jgi:hypothetical protein
MHINAPRSYVHTAPPFHLTFAIIQNWFYAHCNGIGTLWYYVGVGRSTRWRDGNRCRRGFEFEHTRSVWLVH